MGMLSVFTCEMLSMYRVEMLHLYVFHLPAGFMCLKLCLSPITSPLTGVFLLPYLFVSVFFVEEPLSFLDHGWYDMKYDGVS